jgi:hypothetical protein
MRCQSFRDRVHDFIDGTLAALDMAEMSAHEDACPDCRKLHAEYLLVGAALSGRVRMPEAAAEVILRRIQAPRGFGLEALRDWADGFRAYWRDLDQRIIWARVTAMPFTLFLFAFLLIQFVPSKVENLVFLVVSAGPARGGELTLPVVSSVQARQQKEDLNGLVDAAWRLPYEDSLSLVAEIGPAGFAEIDSILEYPKSSELLNAVNLSLRRSHFERTGGMGNSLLIFSFQKIDVYDRVLGL